MKNKPNITSGEELLKMLSPETRKSIEKCSHEEAVKFYTRVKEQGRERAKKLQELWNKERNK